MRNYSKNNSNTHQQLIINHYCLFPTILQKLLQKFIRTALVLFYPSIQFTKLKLFKDLENLHKRDCCQLNNSYFILKVDISICHYLSGGFISNKKELSNRLVKFCYPSGKNCSKWNVLTKRKDLSLDFPEKKNFRTNIFMKIVIN